ncbi:MAG: DUF4097 domain-containing protein [Firmicutes bacterium]|nr:DUF4097 domain-containing protein [Bacillota bacterium]
MENERMEILKMIQDGKITPADAATLLNALENGSKPTMPSMPPMPSVPPPHSPETTDYATSQNSNAPEKSNSGVDFNEIGRKFFAFAKDLEPKIQKAVEFTAEKTVVVADKLSKSIETGVKNFEKNMETKAAAKPVPPTVTTTTGGSEQRIEMLVEDGYNELNLSSFNGDTKIIGYNGYKISATLRYQAKRSSATIELKKLGNKYYLKYAEEDFKFVHVDAYVPSQKFNVASITCLNGNLDLSELSCNQIQISNTNGQTQLKQIAAQNIKSDTSNGRLTISHIAANEAVFEHCNGAIELDEIDVEKLAITNFNGFISAIMSNFGNFSQYLWKIETSNAKLGLNLPTLPNLGYHLKAESSLGDVRIGLTGLQFITNDQGFVEAKTMAFESKPKQVRLSLETSNAHLTVN